jgi:hypothetical protein
MVVVAAGGVQGGWQWRRQLGCGSSNNKAAAAAARWQWQLVASVAADSEGGNLMAARLQRSGGSAWQRRWQLDSGTTVEATAWLRRVGRRQRQLCRSKGGGGGGGSLVAERLRQLGGTCGSAIAMVAAAVVAAQQRDGGGGSLPVAAA